MANIGFVKTQLNGIEDETMRRILGNIFDHILNNLRFGAPDHQTRAENFQVYFEKSTTATDGSEFSFRHGLPAAPKYAIPVLDLNLAGARTPDLQVSRVADANRIYLRSTSTSAPILLLVE